MKHFTVAHKNTTFAGLRSAENKGKSLHAHTHTYSHTHTLLLWSHYTSTPNGFPDCAPGRLSGPPALWDYSHSKQCHWLEMSDSSSAWAHRQFHHCFSRIVAQKEYTVQILLYVFGEAITVNFICVSISICLLCNVKYDGHAFFKAPEGAVELILSPLQILCF